MKCESELHRDPRMAGFLEVLIVLACISLAANLLRSRNDIDCWHEKSPYYTLGNNPTQLEQNVPVRFG